MSKDRDLITPSPRVRASLESIVKQDFTIVASNLLWRVLGVYVLTSLVILSMCEQMGVKLWGPINLMHVFMWAGPVGCQILCGALYLGCNFLVMSRAMPRHELTWFRQRLPLIILGFAMVSLALLGLMGRSDSYLVSWGVIGGSGGAAWVVVAWLVGALVGARVFFALGLRI